MCNATRTCGAAALVCALVGAAHSQPGRLPSPSPAPIEAALIVGAPDEVSAMSARLTGHRWRRGEHVLILEDIAGQGAPWVGHVALRCGQLWLRTAMQTFRLVGPLARPRLAGPGYLMWVVGHRGEERGEAETLEILRLGVLAPPPDRAAPIEEASAPCASSLPGALPRARAPGA